MPTDGYRAIRPRFVDARRPALGQPSQSGAAVNHTLAIVRDAARMADLAAEIAADVVHVHAEPAKPAPANDVLPASRLPTITRRLHLPPATPAMAMCLFDWAAAAFTAEAAAWWAEGADLIDVSLANGLVYVAAALFLKIGAWLTSAYRVKPHAFAIDHSLGGLAAGVVAGLALISLATPNARAAAAMAVVLPAAAIVLALGHALLSLATKAALKAGAFTETVVIVGATTRARALTKALQANKTTQVVAIVDERRPKAQRRAVGVKVLGDIEDLLAWPSLAYVDRIVLALPPNSEARIKETTARLKSAPNRIDLALEIVDGGVVFARLSGTPRCLRRAFAKRMQDIIFGALLLAVFAAPMLLIAAAVKLDGGTVLFREQRHGFNQRPFTLRKFRTLRADTGKPTGIGRFLRRSGLDELPQLFNVLVGEMSLVGPRPHRINAEASGRAYNEVVVGYAHRHRVKPGLTGLAQVAGCRGSIKTSAALRKRVKLDLEYVENASLGLDLGILWRTATIVLADTRAALTGG